ncbi:hypothetical protein C8034_v001991 [Colletotrichum sidae]|uniref:Uncharacterized protein n=1 Tax=Colletotrichum sidae TaxID=1347389 RepID=A0A4R8TCZ6_9PEZI|nr:hypothetical protein C8034_v001991 [Colletotrichum sidae]
MPHHTNDGGFEPGVAQRKRLCALGNTALAALNIVALVLSVVAYVQGSKKKPEELAQCILTGIFLPFVALSAYLIVSLKPGNSITFRLMYVAVVTVLYCLFSFGFGVVFATRLIRGDRWKGEVTTRTATAVINIVNAYDTP